MTPAKLVSRALSLLLVCAAAAPLAHATSVTYAGTFSSDSQVNQYSFTAASASTYDLYTTSYAGGANLNGTTAVSGGFVPVLSLFNATTGSFIAAAAA